MKKFYGVAAAAVLVALFGQTGIAAATSFNSSSPTELGGNQSVGSVVVSRNASTETVATVTVSGLPFTAGTQATNTTNTSVIYNVWAEIPANFDPGVYTGTATVSFANQTGQSTAVTVEVPEVKRWNITKTVFADNISVGSTALLAELTLQNTGNVPVSLNAAVYGNATAAATVSFNRQPILYPGPETRFRVRAAVPRTTRFGNYSTTLSLNGRNVTASTRFEDRINPRIRTFRGFENGFMATQPEPLTVVATDNVGVANVTASIYFQDTVEKNNKSVQITKKLESGGFTKQNDAGKWRYVFNDADDINNYTMNITVEDAAGNSRTYTRYVDVYGLQAVYPSTDWGEFSMPFFRTGTRGKKKVATIEANTSVNVSLEGFSQPLAKDANETWVVGLAAPEGDRYFDGVNDTVQIGQSGDVYLFLRSDTVERFNGELRWEYVEQHVGVKDTTFFEGEFRNWSRPKKHITKSLGEYRLELKGFAGPTPAQSGYRITGNITCVKIEGDCRDPQLKLIASQKVKDGVIDRWRSSFNRVKNTKNMYGLFLFLAVVGIAALSKLVIYMWRYHGEYAVAKKPLTMEERKQNAFGKATSLYHEAGSFAPFLLAGGAAAVLTWILVM